MNQDLLKLFQDEEFAKEAVACESVENVLELIKSNGIITTRDEFDSFMDNIARIKNTQEGELDETELEQVTGGEFLTFAAIVAAVGAVVGAAKWYIYDEPYSRGKQKAKAENNRRKNKIC